jgi:hypothetical protein
MPTSSVVGLGTCALLLLPVCAMAGELLIAQDGKSAYEIVVPNEKSVATRYAATELQTFLAAATGAKLPIVTERQASGGPAFLVGPSQPAGHTALIGKAQLLGEDGVLLKTVGEDVVLLGGGDRGQLYSVYVLLERYLGVRFLARDCTVVPKASTLSLPTIDYRYSPRFAYREELYHDALDWPFAARLKLNGSNMALCAPRMPDDRPELIPGVLISPFVHASCTMLPSDTYFPTHPEYYGLVNGQRHGGVIGSQLCYTNPDVIRICTDFVLKWIADHPDVACVDVSQNDAYPGQSGACECDKCMAVVNEEGTQAGPLLRFVNAIAAVVAERYPGKFVETLAYQHTIAAPKITKPLPNVVVRLCHYACYFHGVECSPLGDAYRAAIDDWRRIARSIYVWHYGVNFWHYLAPNPNLRSLVEDIRYYEGHGVNGVMLQGDIQSTGGELSDFRMYLTAQLLWDPSRDPMEIRREFCEGYYGPAKDDVLEFLAAMDRLGEATDKHIPMNGWNPPDIATPEFVTEAMAILDRALARTDDPVIRNRVEKLMLPYWYVQLAWPDVYGLTPEAGRAMAADFRRVTEANGIDTIAEGPPNVASFLAAVEARYAGAGSQR